MRDTGIQEGRLQLMDTETARSSLDPAFKQAVGRSPGSLVENHYRVAGHTVLVRVAGRQQAADIDKALSHLRSDAGAAPELTIEIWDDAETGPVSFASWPTDDDFYPDFRGAVSSSEDSHLVLHQRQSSLMLLDRKNSRIVGCVRGTDALFQDERARPFHLLLMIWLDDRSIHFIHSALVAEDGLGLLIAGRSGAGKTTSSISCLLSGFTFLSDDYVALGAGPDGKFVGHSLYATCLVDHVNRFPELAPLAYEPNCGRETKSVVYLADNGSSQFAADTPLAALVLPKIVDRPDTVYYRARPVEAMMELAPSSLWLLPNAHSLQKMAELVEKTPAYRLELGRDVGQIAPTLRRLIAELQE